MATPVAERAGQPAQDTPGWRLWVSTTGRHWALRTTILTAAQIAAGARPMLWAQDSAGLAALIAAQQKLTTPGAPRHSPDRGPDHTIR